MAKSPKEIRFTGKIQSIEFGSMRDAWDVITVDGKKIVFRIGGMPSPQSPALPDHGSLIGFKFPESHSMTVNSFNGREAEVFARPGITGHESEADSGGYFTLYGNKDYFVKLK